MITAQIIQRVQSAYSKGIQSADTRLSNRHIYNKILSSRSLLLSQKANKNQKIGQLNYQTIPCVDMVSVPIVECPCIPARDQYILKSTHRFPWVISGISSHLIQNITSTDGSTRFSETKWETMSYSKADKYTSAKGQYFLRNGFLYISNSKEPEIITVTGLFEDPLEVLKYPGSCCVPVDPCIDPMEMEFPMDSALIDAVVQLCTEELIKLFMSIKQDSNNNSRDDRQQQLQQSE